MNLKKEFQKVESYLDKIESIRSVISKSDEIEEAEIDLLRTYLEKAARLCYELNRDEVKAAVVEVQPSKPVPILEKSNGQKEEAEIVEEVKATAISDPSPSAEVTIDNEVNSKNEVHEDTSLNDLLKGESKDLNSLSSMVNSYRDLISLNDKILFINDLFDGDKLAYNKTISALDNLGNESDTIEFLEQSAVQAFNWNEKEESKEKFYRLISLRYTSL